MSSGKRVKGSGSKVEKAKTKKVSEVRTNNKVVAIAVTDLHLSEKAPVSRAEKDNWLEGPTSFYLEQLRIASQVNGSVPILYGGDIFDRWNPSPYLINFAIKNLPFGYAIPGQHDLPFHDYSAMHKSGYGTLVAAKAIVNLPGITSKCVAPNVNVHGFPWKFPIQSYMERRNFDDAINIALVHSYIWNADNCYPGAPKHSFYSSYKKSLLGYDVAVFGDNHKGFVTKVGNCNVSNNGGFMRRKSDEMDYDPCITYIYQDGTVKRHKLKTDDKWIEHAKELSTVSEDVKEFTEFMQRVSDVAINYAEAVSHYLDNKKVSAGVRKIILDSLE